MSPLVSNAIAPIATAAVILALLVWPRGRVTHRHEVFVKAPPQEVWDTYFVHVRKADYRPGTRILDAEILEEAPLTVRLTVQRNTSPTPVKIVLAYDLYEPPNRYRLSNAKTDFVEEGEFVADDGGTRLRLAVTGRMQGFFQPLAAGRRVERNLRALKRYCENGTTRLRAGG